MRKGLYIVLLLLALLSCSGNGERCDRRITVTIEPYRFLVEQIAGPEWEVTTILPKGADPETSDFTARQILSLADSHAYMLVGDFGVEKNWLHKVAAEHPELLMFDTSAGVERHNNDPHIWTSPDNMAQIASNVCNALCSMDSAGSNGYRERLEAFRSMLQVTDTLITEKLAARTDSTFIIFHPSLTYFARMYGLQQLAVEHEGKEPSAAQMQRLIESAKESATKTLFVQQQFDDKHARVVADAVGADIFTIDPLNYDWQGQMLYIADCLSRVQQ